MGFRVNFKDDTPEKLEQGLLVPIGYYHAFVEDVAEGEGGNTKITFQISKGPWVEKKISETLWNPDGSNNEKAAKVNETKIKLWGHRLGLVPDTQCGQDADVELDFINAIGKEVIIHVVHNPSQNDKTKIYANIDFGGVFPLASDKIPMEDRAALSLPVLESQVKAAKEAAANGGKKPRGRPAKGPTTPSPNSVSVDDAILTAGL